MRLMTLPAATATALLAWAAPSHALTVFDVAGTGYVCTYNTDGSCNYEFPSFTGTVTIDVNPAGPSGDFSYTDGTNHAYDDSNWVTTTFQLGWSGGTYTSVLVPNGTFTSAFARVTNDYPLYGTNQDTLYSSYFSSVATYTSTTYYQSTNSAYLDRRTDDLSWLSSVDFIESAGLAPDGLNYIAFQDYSNGYDFVTNQSFGWLGFTGIAYLTSMTPRASVPEPGTLALLSLGLAGLGFSRRKKQN